MSDPHSSGPTIPHTAVLEIELDTRRLGQPRSHLQPSPMGSRSGSSPVPPSIFSPAMSLPDSASTASTSSTTAAGTAGATPTPLPFRPGDEDKAQQDDSNRNAHSQAAAAAGGTSKSKDRDFNLPKLRLRIDDISHPGAAIFLENYNASKDLEHCVRSVVRQLYSEPGKPSSSSSSPVPVAPHLHVPPTRSVTLILRDMPGVAYTTGSDLDSDHKEIHFSLGYIQGISQPSAGSSSSPSTRRHDEIMGVVTHELVHCYQYNARGSCPGGLIEGVADWVRLQCQLAPPHWKRGEGVGDGDGKDKGQWDAGYQRTAFFLEYLAGRFGADTVRKLNEKLRTTRKYEDKPFWTELLGRPVEQLWEDYRKHVLGKENLSA